MKKLFIAFLKTHKALTKFKRNLNKMRLVKLEVNEYVNQMIDDDILNEIIGGGFTWSESPEGFDYWSDLDNKWKDKLNKT